VWVRHNTLVCVPVCRSCGPSTECSLAGQRSEPTSCSGRQSRTGTGLNWPSLCCCAAELNLWRAVDSVEGRLRERAASTREEDCPLVAVRPPRRLAPLLRRASCVRTNWLQTTRWPQKLAQFLYAVTLPHINRFSKLFHCQNQEKICNKNPTTPQLCCYSTMRNVKCLKSNNRKQYDFCNKTF